MKKLSLIALATAMCLSGGIAAASLLDILGRPLEPSEREKALEIVRTRGGVDSALGTAQGAGLAGRSAVDFVLQCADAVLHLGQGGGIARSVGAGLGHAGIDLGLGREAAGVLVVAVGHGLLEHALLSLRTSAGSLCVAGS